MGKAWNAIEEFGGKLKDVGEQVGKYGAPIVYYPTKGAVQLGQKFAGGGGPGSTKGHGIYAPQPQFWGGSEEKYKEYQNKYDAGVVRANERVTDGLRRGDAAARKAGRLTDEALGRNDGLENRMSETAVSSRKDMERAQGDYRNVRGSTLADADALRAQATNMEKTYQQTADRQFGINQDRNMRALQSAAAAGGSAGSLRDAMATAGEANADAAANAEITRANEFNQLQSMKMQGLANSAGIRAGVGNQDISMAGMASGRELSARQMQESLINQRANLFGAQADREMGAAAARTSAGIAQQGNYLGARGRMESDMLGASQTAEDQRQQYMREMYTRNNYPFMSFLNTPSG